MNAIISNLRERFNVFAVKFGNLDFVIKLRALPENQKKIIFFVAIGISIVVIGIYEIILTKNNIAKIGASVSGLEFPKFDMPDTKANMPSLSGLDFSNVSQGDQQVINPDMVTGTESSEEIEKEQMR